MGGGGGNNTVTALFVVGGSVVNSCAGTDVSLFCAGTGISPFTLYTSGTLEDSLTVLFSEGTVCNTCVLCFDSRRETECDIDVSVVSVRLEQITVGSAKM